MLTIHSGTYLQSLAEALLQQFKKSPSKHILAPELFVVQNHGMARWLSLYIAEKEGIAANLEFKFPAEVYWKVLRVMDPEIPENLPSERQPMTWAIFDILQSDIKGSLPVLHQYIHRDDSLKQEIRSWNLACRIADVFDQYLTYRPAMLLGWEKGNLKTKDSSEQWQAVLWQELMRHWHGNGKRKWDHRAELGKQLYKKLDEQAIPSGDLPARISVFGVTEMPEVYLKTFLKLSTTIDIHFYLLDVSENTENFLVDSLGRATRDFTVLLKEELQKENQINRRWIDAEEAGGPDNKKLFDIFKRDLIGKSLNADVDNVDESMQVHSCHSPRREVEVLYDQLLNLFNEDRTLDPSDVLVLSPQMDAYAPIIDAVFGAPEKDMPEIPYHLSDSLASTQIVNLSFQKLLDLVDSRFKVTDVMDLLDFKPIRDAFSLSEDDISTLERWIGDNHIRWGLDGEHKTELGLPESNSFTWQAGLHRMMAGYAMDTKEDLLFDNIYPYDEIQKADHGQLLGRFSRLLHYLSEYHQKTKEPLSAMEWSKLFIQWLSIFYTEDESFYRQIQWLREQFTMLSDQANRGDFIDTISYPVIKRYITDTIEQRSTGGGRAGTGVTFSSLVQMHSIPCKVICMIGMDDGVFPASKNGVEFDLITKYPQAGDRVQRRNDRQIFLETILAAEKAIYFSYIGQSNRKEVEFPPSVVLRELIDYIANKYKIDIDELLQKHKLHAFSPKYFNNFKDKRLFSFSVKNRRVAEQLLNGDSKDQPFIRESLPEPDEGFKQLTVADFVSFFQHPARFFLQQRLGIYLGEEKVLDEDREAFGLNNLEKYNLGQELLDYYLANKSMESYREVAVAKDLLPENWPGEQVFDQQLTEVRAFGSKIQQVLDQKKLDSIELDIQVNDFHIFGRLDQIFEQEQLLFRFGKLRAKDRIAFWIKHLLLQEVKPDNHSGITRLFTFENHQSVEATVLPSLVDSTELLNLLLNYYWRGLQKGISFFPESSFAYAEMMSKGRKDKGDAMKAAEKKWINKHSYINEGKDAYNARITGSIKALKGSHIEEEFKIISTSFWNPFLDLENNQKRIAK